MCGIAGIVSFSEPLVAEHLHAMTRCMAHRGPNAEGFYFDGKVGLGHRRLSILDLSDAANQPMYSADGRYVIVYNGEVYNFLEIAQKLNLPLRTTSDTEVIIEAFVKWGPEFVQELNGMFAFAIYDLIEKTLFLYRDRMGIKPVFYYFDGQCFAFASELKSILNLPFLKGKLCLNKEAVSQFLHLGYIPRPNSIYTQIQKMESGSYMVLKRSAMESRTFWKLEEQVEPELIRNEVQSKEILKELVISSVKYRMISDVPFGTFLSGGIDSSLVTAAAQEVSDSPVSTFSIGFEEQKFNELPYARAVSKHLGTAHHEFVVTYKEAMNQILDLTDIYDEPFGDPSAVPSLLVSQMARKHVTMTLSGDGGDELFFGYGMYNWARRLNNPFLYTLRFPISNILAKFGNRYERAASVFKVPSKGKLKSHLFSQEQYFFSEAELIEILQPPYTKTLILQEELEGLARKFSSEEAQALFDMKYYLQDDLLVKMDRATMKHSLETRVPLLDYRIIRFALNLSPDLKIKNGQTKYLLKQVLFDWVPEQIFDRPKRGFAIPVAAWLKKELNYLLQDVLSERVVNQFGIVKYQMVKRLKDEFMAGKDYYYNRLWLLIILHKWLLKNGSNLSDLDE